MKVTIVSCRKHHMAKT